MRHFGANNPHEYYVPPDTVGTVIISTALAVVAQSWPTGAHLASFKSSLGFYLNLGSTSVNIPTTNSSGTTASSGLNLYQSPEQDIIYKIPAATTGYSITAATSGVVTAAFWKISG